MATQAGYLSASIQRRAMYSPRSLAVQRGLLAGIIISLFTASGLIGQENTKDLNVGIRTEVAWPTKAEKSAKNKKSTEADAPKLYGILSVTERNSPEKLVKPVDPEMIAQELDAQLRAQGFQHMVKGQKPQIVIAAEYGRSYLPNPYMGTTRAVTSIDGDAPIVTIAGSDVGQLVRQQEFGMQEKIQRASYEKLFIEVTAWKYPSSPKDKPVKLWTLLMNVDDPDHRDLNGAFKEMFAAGAPYFGKQTKETEIEVRRPMKEGRVEIGTSTVVPDVPPAKK